MNGEWWWIDRWRKSTAYTDMTAEEQGLYRNLLDEVWLRPTHVIPDDPRILARVSGDHEAWARCGAKVLGWMRRVPGGWTNDTAVEVITRGKAQHHIRSVAGEKGLAAVDRSPSGRFIKRQAVREPDRLADGQADRLAVRKRSASQDDVIGPELQTSNEIAKNRGQNGQADGQADGQSGPLSGRAKHRHPKPELSIEVLASEAGPSLDQESVVAYLQGEPFFNRILDPAVITHKAHVAWPNLDLLAEAKAASAWLAANRTKNSPARFLMHWFSNAAEDQFLREEDGRKPPKAKEPEPWPPRNLYLEQIRAEEAMIAAERAAACKP